ncbi:competence protein ComFB [bacterium 1xD42-67]|nr:competence protein ComFB [bacterium 1xD42-67]
MDMAVEFRNLMEDIVMQNLDIVMAAEGGCTCDACRSDVVAYTLNHLKPHYVATRQGRLMVKLKSCELQSRADVVAAISEAAVMVSKTPRHGRS